MEDELDKIIVEPIENRVHPSERKKLQTLKNNAEECYQRVNKLENERLLMLRNLPFNMQEEKDKAKFVRDNLLNQIKVKMDELKEERKGVHQTFRGQTQHIREKRKEDINKDKNLELNKKQKAEGWEEHRKSWMKFHNYYDSLHKKYPNNKKFTIKTI